jgi:preprotein translocase subunit SecE
MANSPKNKDTKDVVGPSKFSVERIKEFSGEVQREFNKIAWPDKKHTLGSTGVVVVLVMIISCYLGAVDLLLGKLIGFILN